MVRSAHREKLIKQYPSLINGDPNFRTSGHVHLGRRIICRNPNNISISGLTNATRRNGVRGTIIGFLSESDVDKLGNAAFVATKTSQFSKEGEPSRLFHIVLDEKDKDNDTVVVDLEEWEIDDYCEWIAVDEGGTKNEGENQKRDNSASRVHAQPKSNDQKGTKTTEFEMLNNLALEAAASVSNTTTVVGTAIANIDDGKATLAEAAATGCTKCRKELDTGKKAPGPHVKNCPRNGLWKSEEKLSNSRDNTATQSSKKKTIDSNGSGEKLVNSDKLASLSNTTTVVETEINTDDGKVTRAEAAAAGCTKCRKELDTGKKAPGPHVRHCPRKGLWKSEEKLGKGEGEVGDAAKDEALPDGAKSISPAPTSESSPAKVEKDEDMVETQIDVSEKKKPAQRTFPAPPTLEEAAAAGCKKCRLEFETGEKTRKTHNDNCPRKWKSAGKPPPDIPAPTAGRKKRVQSRACSSQSMEEDESAVAALVAAATANTRRSSKRNTDARSSKKKIDSNSSGKSAGKLGNSDKHKDNTEAQSSKNKIDSSNSGGRLFNSDERVKSRKATGTQSSKKKIDSSRRGNVENNEGRLNQDHARALASAPCPSFNDILKSALASYSSNAQKKNTNNPPPPVPPPFLSHEENCTIRTALAFAMAKARNKGKRSNNTPVPRGSTSNAAENAVVKISADRLGGAIQTNGLGSHGHSPLVGGLLALPPRDCPPIGQMNLNASNAKIVLDRELKHVRDVMNLAVSALLPLYKSSTLQVQSAGKPGVDGQRQCTVYDYESAAKPSSLRGSQFQLHASERHLASLDGLCRHLIGRLSSIVNDKALRRKLANESSTMMPTGASQEDHIEFSINEEEIVSEEDANTDIVRDAVAQLQMDFMIDSFRHSSDPVQQIHQVLASCHVLHRLLLLDENCTTLGSDCVAMACAILTDLHNDKFIGSRNDGGLNQLRRLEGFEEQDGKEKHQVVPSRWSYTASSYNTNREERRKQAVYAISQRCNSNGPPLTGMKRSANQSQDESSGYQTMQLPRLGDVLAVNLLRLLEGASAIRLHFHRRYVGQNNGYVASTVATSAAAAEVLQEIRSKADHDLLMPIHINDAASVYYHETLHSQERRSGKVDHLRPGAKMMLRIHLFGLIQKLSMYEQG
eukprot:scaffold3549_cov119-Skeletonema_marinoi.AAC.1